MNAAPAGRGPSAKPKRVRSRAGVSVSLPEELQRPIPEAQREKILRTEAPDLQLAEALLGRGIALLARAYDCISDDGMPDLRALIVALAIDLRIPAFTSLEGSRGRGRPRKERRLSDLKVFQLVTMCTRLPIHSRGRDRLTIEQACELIARSNSAGGVSADTLKRRYDYFRPQAEFLRANAGIDLIGPVDEVIEGFLREQVAGGSKVNAKRSAAPRATR